MTPIISVLMILVLMLPTGVFAGRKHRILSEAHLEVLEISAVMDFPRVFAVSVSKLLERHTSPKTQKRFLQFLKTFECLERWPSRFLSGHFVAVRVIKR